MIEWYTAIRTAKLNRLGIAYPSVATDEVRTTDSYFLTLLIAFFVNSGLLLTWKTWKSRNSKVVREK